MTKRKLLFSVGRKDLVVQTFRSGGPGGQHQNKSNTGVRIIHGASGARGESRSERSQHQNRKLALQRLADAREFQLWARMQAGGAAMVETRVNQAMLPHNLKIEVVNAEGRWCPV